MDTPPNSYTSDIRFISPGSSEFDEFDELGSKLYQSYIKRESIQYLMSPKDFEATLHKDFDILRATTEHQTTSVDCCGVSIEVDEMIAPLFEIINREELLTTQSCQYNNSGYAYISFTLEGFLKWCNLLLKKAIAKYRDDAYYDCRILDRFSYTETDRKTHIGKTKNINNIIYFTSGIYHGTQEFIFGVTWMFLPDEIDSIYKEIKELLE